MWLTNIEGMPKYFFDSLKRSVTVFIPKIDVFFLNRLKNGRHLLVHLEMNKLRATVLPFNYWIPLSHWDVSC